MKLKLVFILLFILSSSMAFGGWTNRNSLNVAIIDFNSRLEKEKIDTVTLTELLQTEFSEKADFSIVERSMLKNILEEQKLDMTGLVDDSKAAKIGSLAGADKIIAGSISKIGDFYFIIIKGIDTKKGTVEISDKVMVHHSPDIIEILPALADRFIKKTKGENVGPFTLKDLANIIKDDTVYSNIPASSAGETAAVSSRKTSSAAEKVSRHFSLDKKSYSTGEKISAAFHDMPGNEGDWITLVSEGASDEEWGSWQWTNGKKSGEFELQDLKKGSYELRAYYDWPSGGYTVQDKLIFKVE